MLFPPLDGRNTRDKAQGLCITSEGYNCVNHFCLPGWVLLANQMVCERGKVLRQDMAVADAGRRA